MANSIAREVRYGKSCLRCRAYFVTLEEEVKICPWCERIEVGGGIEEAYEPSEQPTG